MNKQFGKVIILTGGWGSEREISLMSGHAVLEALAPVDINVELVDIKSRDDLIPKIMKTKPDRVFIAMHGIDGECGFIQAILDGFNIPYTSSGVAASALTLDKIKCKWLWLGIGLPTPDSVILDESTNADEVIARLGLPLFIKPSHDGSSLGVSKVNSREQFESAHINAKKYDKLIYAERFMSGGEYTVGIIADKAFPSIKIETPREFYDYQAKYFVDDTVYHCPSGLTDEEENTIQQLALKAYYATGCRIWGRVDIMRDSHGQFKLIEINTIPGLTSHSLVPMAANQVGMSFTEMILKIMQQTI